LTWHYKEVSGQLHALAALPPASIGKEAGWAPEPAWTQWGREKFPAPAGNQPPNPIFQLIASHHTN